MRKKFHLFILLLMIMTLAGCGGSASNNNTGDKNAGEQTMSALKNMPEFELKDLEGNTVSNETLADYNLTLINVWGTFCTPCINEMPELEALSNELKNKGVNIIGIISDGMQNEDLARQISEQQGIHYANIIPDQQFMDDFVSRTDVVPVSILINNKGERVGQVIVGSRSREEYQEIIEEALNK